MLVAQGGEPFDVRRLLALLAAIAAVALDGFYRRTSMHPTRSGRALFLAVALASAVALLLPKGSPRLALLAFAAGACFFAGELTVSGFGFRVLGLAVLASLAPAWALAGAAEGPELGSGLAVVGGGLAGLACELLLFLLARRS